MQVEVVCFVGSTGIAGNIRQIQVCKPLFRSEIEAAIFGAKYKLRTNAQMFIRYVSIRPLFKEKIFGRRKDGKEGGK